MTAASPVRRVLITGGIRSGKSREAERRLADVPAVTYVAAGNRDDDDPEWAARIDAHRARRPAGWTTVETLAVADLLRDTGAEAAPLLVECVNTWLAGTMAAAGCWAEPDDGNACKRLTAAVDDLVDAWAETSARVVAVTNEVGLSLVPTTRAGRWFAEELGTLNARLAAVADEVWLVVAGIPTRLK
jgi:adenosylcobinamide kinase/adenosylcobinamide-phosphate guanylyltransferase